MLAPLLYGEGFITFAVARALGGASFSLAFFGAVLAYGFWSEIVPNDDRLRWSVIQTIALMHFYYDGFIWSVRKEDV